MATLTLPGDPLFPTIPGWDVPEETRFVLQDGARWQPLESLIGAIDQVIAYFNARRMDLPDGFFDRRTQFVINGAPFETLLGTAAERSADPDARARARPAFDSRAKALQHAMPDAKLERGEIVTDGDPSTVAIELWLSGTAARHRRSGERGGRRSRCGWRRRATSRSPRR